MDAIFTYAEEVFQDICTTFGIWDVCNSCSITNTILSAKVHTGRCVVTAELTQEQTEGGIFKAALRPSQDKSSISILDYQ